MSHSLSNKKLVIPLFATRCVTFGISMSQNPHAIFVNARAAKRLNREFTKNWILNFNSVKLNPQRSVLEEACKPPH